MLVEDDNNLREIYEARLLVEGYEVISAHDGEEALAMAVKEKPDVIIADIMMPKISGFDMLDILRSTTETRNSKVIMMTALSQNEDKARADKLGADKYLVKSQVTLEDVAAAVKDVLGVTEAEDQTAQDSTSPASPAVVPEPSLPIANQSPPPSNNTSMAPNTEAAPANDRPMATPDPAAPIPTPIYPQDNNSTADQPIAPTPTPIVVSSGEPSDNSDSNKTPDTANSGPQTAGDANSSQTTANEEQVIDKQIDDFVSTTYGDSTQADSADSVPEPPTINSQSAAETPSLAADIDVPDQNTGAENEDRPSGEIAPKTGDDANHTDQESPVTNLSKQEVPPNDSNGSVPIAHKKVIQPINDITVKPSLSSLLEQEQAKENDSATVAPAAAPPSGSMVVPNGPVIVPAQDNAARKKPEQDHPGNIIAPSGPDPNSIAL